MYYGYVEIANAQSPSVQAPKVQATRVQVSRSPESKRPESRRLEHASRLQIFRYAHFTLWKKFI